MDRSLYVAMTGASQILRAQAETSHNIANASTVGFKSELSAFRSAQVAGDGMATRINAVAQGTGQDLSAGKQMTTGRDLDVSVQGRGWIAVQSADGSEGYTRAGDLKISAEGLLTDARGNPVLGGGGAISVPPSSHLSIGADGSVSVVPLGEKPNTMVTVDRIRLVDPDPANLQMGGDGLMHASDGSQAPADDEVKLASGVLEASNVSPSSELVKMISLSRQFEMQVRAIRSADENEQTSTKLLQAN